ncbi:hypothetical protein DL768_001222 [Monosporascus sp. mg162]|nr:hypothetical protein DL768_001222 [Monosporascus sp. mg162]
MKPTSMVISALAAMASAAPAATEIQGKRGNMDLGEDNRFAFGKDRNFAFGKDNDFDFGKDNDFGKDDDFDFAKEELREYNDFAFANEELQYFNAINDFDLQALVKLLVFKNLDMSDFKDVFVLDEFDINALLQLQVIALLSQLAAAGLFDDFDVTIIKVKTIDLGLLSDLGHFDVASLIDDSLVPQMQDVIEQSEVEAVIISDDDDDSEGR